jgi:hypothetical protein
MRSTFEELRTAPAASLNLALSGAALPLAEYMKRRFGIPFIDGIPVGLDGEARLRASLAACIAGTQPNTKTTTLTDAPVAEKGGAGGKTLVFAEPLLARAIRRRLGSAAEAYSFFAGKGSALAEDVTHVPTEAAAEKILSRADTGAVVADPLVKALIGGERGIRFLPLPHRAVSGRLAEGSVADLFGRRGETFFAALWKSAARNLF